MTESEVLGVFQEAIILVLKLSAPLLIVSIIVGLVVAIFQAATQIHEQTLTFVPKVLAAAVILWLLGSWMIHTMSDFVRYLFDIMARL